ncbi:MAG: putative tail fiber protein [Prokaryotic dsDNA virus sp.]|nr:MAG: putative tail fiber protein [Prokaryotic dsDNA virus sp.]|tara:strand:- start:6349 stop:9042 length:2694 start_codon:yes stop_codon:yes gene_type:complete
MATTQNTYTGNGSTTNYSFTFPYLKEADVKVTLDGVLTTAYSLANATSVAFNSAPASGVQIIIYRDTDNDTRAATFFAGSAIKAEDLNANFDQLSYVSQETENNSLSTLGDTMSGDIDMNNLYTVTNLATPSATSDAVRKDYVDAAITTNAGYVTASENARDAAQLAQTAAETAKTAAQTSETNAATSAQNAAVNQAIASAAKVDALTYRNAAYGYWVDASNEATAAASSATAAASSATTASNAQLACTSAESSVLAAFDQFDDTYLGAKATDPTVDNDGDPLTAGDLYYNISSSVMKVYTGSAWVSAYVPGDAANILSTASGNLTSTNVQAALQELQGDIDGISVDYNDDDELLFGDDNDFKIVFDGTYEDLKLTFNNSNGDIKFYNAGSYWFYNVDGTKTAAVINPNGNVRLNFNGLTKLETHANGVYIAGISVGEGEGTGTGNTTCGQGSLYQATTGSENTAVGKSSLYSVETGTGNTAVGADSGKNIDTGAGNTLIGDGAGEELTSGQNNVAIGQYACEDSTTGSGMIGIGRMALFNCNADDSIGIGQNTLTNTSTGDHCIAIGKNALNVSTGADNTCIGYESGKANTTGINNTALGYKALASNTNGYRQVAIGYQALQSNTTADWNVAIGADALSSTQTGSFNTAVGSDAGKSNVSSYFLTCVGYKSCGDNTGDRHATFGSNVMRMTSTAVRNSLFGASSGMVISSGSYNSCLGYEALRSCTTGDYNTGVGYQALRNLTTGDGNVQIGGPTSAGSLSPVFNVTTEDDRVVVGSTSVTNAYVQVAWTVVSDERDKTNFGTVPHGVDFVKQLNPVSFQFKVDRDTDVANGPVRYGFKAQDILALEGESNVIIDNEDPNKLRYNGEALVPVLVNAIKEQQVMIDALTARLDAAGL